MGDSGKLEATVDRLLNEEKQMRLAENVAGTRKAATEILQLCFEAKDWKLLNEQILNLSKKRGQLKQAVQSMVQQAMQYIDQTPDIETRIELIKTLNNVSAGKIYVEIERARQVDDVDDGDDESEEGDEFQAGSGIPNTFERLEYEALAEKKRKALADSQRDSSGKRTKYDAIDISNSTSGVEGFMEYFSSGRRKKSRKDEHRKRGRRHGSKKEVAPDILNRFREALFLHAHGRDIEALPMLVEVIKQAPTFDKAYYYLSRVSEQLGRTDSLSTEALKIAANIKGPKSPFWKLLYERVK